MDLDVNRATVGVVEILKKKKTIKKQTISQKMKAIPPGLLAGCVFVSMTQQSRAGKDMT